MYTSEGLSPDEEPNPWYKTFWCILFLILPVGVLFLEHNIEGLNVLSTIQSMTTVSSLPVLIALYFLFASFRKALNKDIQDGTILDSVEDKKAYKWNIEKKTNI